MSYPTLPALTEAHPEWRRGDNLPDVLTVSMVAVYAQRHPESVLDAMNSGRLGAGRTSRQGNWHTHLTDVQRWLRGMPAVRAPRRSA